MNLTSEKEVTAKIVAGVAGLKLAQQTATNSYE